MLTCDEIMVVMIFSALDTQVIWNNAEKQFLNANISETLRKLISVSQNSILLFQSSVDTIGKLGPIGKIMLYIVSQG